VKRPAARVARISKSGDIGDHSLPDRVGEIVWRHSISLLSGPLLLPERVTGGMEADHQAAGEEERDLGARLAADCARLQGRILQGEAGTFIRAAPFDRRSLTRQVARGHQRADLGAELTARHGWSLVDRRARTPRSCCHSSSQSVCNRTMNNSPPYM